MFFFKARPLVLPVYPTLSRDCLKSPSSFEDVQHMILCILFPSYFLDIACTVVKSYTKLVFLGVYIYALVHMQLQVPRHRMSLAPSSIPQASESAGLHPQLAAAMESYDITSSDIHKSMTSTYKPLTPVICRLR